MKLNISEKLLDDIDVIVQYQNSLINSHDSSGI